MELIVKINFDTPATTPLKKVEVVDKIEKILQEHTDVPVSVELVHLARRIE